MPRKEFADQPPRRAHVQCWTDLRTDRQVRAYAASQGVRLNQATEQLVRSGLASAAGGEGLRPSQTEEVFDELVRVRELLEILGPVVLAAFELSKLLAIRGPSLGLSAEELEAEAVSHSRARWEVVNEAVAAAVARRREDAGSVVAAEEVA